MSLFLFVGCSDDTSSPEENNGNDDNGVIYGDGVTDIDGNEYITVIIGNQEWMAENLRVTSYNNGDDIPTGMSNLGWSSTVSGSYAMYPHDSISGLNSDAEVVTAYGKLYNWHAVNDPRGLCPEGWSVPSGDDWTQLVNYLAGQGHSNSNWPGGAGNALKCCRQVDSPLGGNCDTSEHPRWNPHGVYHGFDAFGFSALPGGVRRPDGNFASVGNFGGWWSSAEDSSTFAWGRVMSSNYGTVPRDFINKRYGLSARCARDIDN